MTEQLYQRHSKHNTMNKAAVSQRNGNPVLEDNRAASPIGSNKFVECAQKMGDKFGVDTSALQATHNSSFPETVGAEATIQSNKIDFAPGKDSEHNIKHEIGHFIVNTQRGTPPVANETVNGQAINTTDEVAADRLASASL